MVGFTTVGSVTGIFIRHRTDFDLVDLLLAMSICALLSVPLTWFWVSCSKVQVSADGLQPRDTWCRLRRVRWTETDSLRSFSFLGLVYLRARGKGMSTTVWVPLFLSRMSAFSVAVEAAA